MQYIIKKVRLKNNTLEVDMEEIIHLEGRPSITNDINKKSDQLVHADLGASFAALVPHMVLICDQKELADAELIILDKEAMDYTAQYLIPRMEPYSVTGFSLAGEGENEGVVLIGQKRLENKMVLNLIAPFSKFSEYKYGAELSVLINKCIEETELYLFDGKCAEPSTNQLDLFEDQEPGSDVSITMSVNGEEEVNVSMDALKKAADKATRKPRAAAAAATDQGY